MKTKTMTTLHLRKSIGPECFRGFLLIPLLFGCFALSPTARADDDDRGNGNTSEGLLALASLTTGINNTANGNSALQNNTTGSNNTANGNSALYHNQTGSINTANGVGR